MPFIWLLCSRFEPQIRHTVDEAGFASFNLNRIEVYNMTVRLTRQLTESDLDIQMYLLEKFAKLRKKRGGVLQDLGETWPSQDDLESLVWRASGQIIFAVTVIKFVDTDDIDYRPQDRLKMILSTEPEAIQASPYPAFDILYRQILSTCRDWDTVRLILRLLITPKYELDEVSRYDHSQVLWNSPSVIAQFLQLGLGDVEMVLLQLRSVIYLPREEDMHPVIRILHTSFTEFLTDKARSGDFFVMRYSREEYNGLVAMLLLRTISSYTAYYPPYHYHSSGQQPSDVAIVGWQAEAKQATDRSTLSWYAFKYWMIYCCRIAHPSTGLFDQLNEFYPESALALALTIPTSNFVSMMLHDWKSCLCWANYNESRAKALQIFIGRMNTLLDPLNGELYIGLSKDCLRHDAIRVVLRAELAYTTPRLGGADILPDIWRYYQTWWTEEHSTVEQRVCPLVLSTHCDRALPEDWVVIRVAPANGRAFNARRPRYTDEKIQWKVFDNDVTHDTSESVEKNIVKEEDLVAFKTRVYELRDLLADLAVPPPDLSPPDPSPPEKPRLESVHEWFRRRGWNG
ncbi:hypothetical protein VNI00_006243 [Paramarasmius palmivorus]|uniref:Uncharacterized protein n=1 Tax=Paramarasmius palmivorus TaxID=297713 RepID=A0AAW0D9T9_9AGAR